MVRLNHRPASGTKGGSCSKTTWLNGTKVVSIKLHSDDWNKRVAAGKFKNTEQFAARRKGHIALQDHGDEVWYRNIRIRRLSP